MPPKKKHICPNEFRGEGARGGCAFEISATDKEGIAYLWVGWSCVVVHQKEIPITWLSELIAIATAHKDGIAGFLKEHEYGGGYALMCNPDGGDMETRPIPEEATNARGIREAPAVTALRRRPRLSNLIDKADDLRKRDKGE